jgi:hypothetical protein
VPWIDAQSRLTNRNAVKSRKRRTAIFNHELAHQVADDDVGQRLIGVPGIGPVTLVAEMADERQYACSRDFAALRGLVPLRPGQALQRTPCTLPTGFACVEGVTHHFVLLASV